MSKIYSTAYTDERLYSEDNVCNEVGELLYKFRGIETNDPYYFTPDFVDNYMVEVKA